MTSQLSETMENLAPLVSHLRGVDGVGELIEQFVESLPRRADEIAAAGEGNGGLAAKLLHQLKGAAGGYGFPEISQAAGELETLILSSGSGEMFESQMINLRRLVVRARLGISSNLLGSASRV